MKYAWIFAASYAVAFVFLLIWSRRQNNRAANHLRELGASDEGIKSFYRQASPAVLFIRPTLFFGTITGLAISGMCSLFM